MEEKLTTLMKTQRRKLYLTQRDVADACGVAVSCYNKWEKGEIKNIKMDKIMKLSRALHIDPASFVFGEDISYKTKLDQFLEESQFDEDETNQLIEFGKYLLSRRNNNEI